MKTHGTIIIQGDLPQTSSQEQEEIAKLTMARSAKRLARLAKNMGVTEYSEAPYPGVFISHDHRVMYDLVELFTGICEFIVQATNDISQKGEDQS